MTENCFHCGQKIEDVKIEFDQKIFCCNGCKTVFEILNQNNLSNYYELNTKAGIKPESAPSHFEFLDTPQIFEKIIDYSEDGITLVTFKIPVIHCSACVWLLESLKNINKNIIYSTVNFTTKTVQIAYRHEAYKLSELANFLTDLGYKPIINLETVDKKPEKIDRTLIIKIGIAGFAFGNIMLLAFPEFLGQNGDTWLEQYNHLFRILMFVLSLPVMLYCASDYYKSAWGALKHGILNIDLPIVIGIFALFFRSCYEAYEGLSNGYFDSLCGLLFFMLLGKYFQQRTYRTLAFDRDYKSFYPIAVTRIDKGKQENVLISNLHVGDRILIRNNEIIPADSILIRGQAYIDNSFITGESRLIEKNSGEKIYAGGKQIGTALELEIIKEVNQSYLTRLWNNEAFKKEDSVLNTITNNISKYFVVVILTITVLSALYWYFVEKNTSQMYQVISAILIVACPCALALSAPFTIGNMMRVFGNKKFYVKDAVTIEKLSKISHIVFDKTGTLTVNKAAKISYIGEKLNETELKKLKSLLQNSSHPLSRSLYDFIPVATDYTNVSEYEEILGKGIKGKIDKDYLLVGSSSFVNDEKLLQQETSVHISINGVNKGYYVFQNQYRPGITQTIQSLHSYPITLLSGDNSSERQVLENIFPEGTTMEFNQSPQDKLEYIKALQLKGEKVMMLGDGLNDAGALKQANVGVAISDDVNSFTPSSDAILDGNNFTFLPVYLKLSKTAMTIVVLCFFISFCYNIIGLSFAVSGKLSPLVAAILMPVSSISVVTFTTLTTLFVGYKAFKSQ
ncbi:heavy metal translocating P-type ATPase metal-binding domain-containing protein [Apibacter sp. HY039]|uniref:heavy metal translocating P-type ATPase n=1 Tax=Apibacter sp. HY039 TaxID=2501476 RepID=UPI000FEBDEA6|nr:heavy metal translocating P-type ATPase metal-binding domain-containing protein [Apibacter sp. HY039]